MMLPDLDALYRRDLHTPHLQALGRIFRDMDAAYDRVADELGFVCTGCEDNCCRSLFYHHTLLEYLMLRTGFAKLPPVERGRVLDRAAGAAARTQERLAAGASVKVMCPLNEKGRCVLYDHRPMICRLHGIPHRLVRPDGRQVDGPGCHMAPSGKGGGPMSRLDRTPFYRLLSRAEQACRHAYGQVPRIKMTLSEMLLTCRPESKGMLDDGSRKEDELEIH
jgi:hypothetical protein